jgi:hypothetical protein
MAGGVAQVVKALAYYDWDSRFNSKYWKKFKNLPKVLMLVSTRFESQTWTFYQSRSYVCMI